LGSTSTGWDSVVAKVAAKPSLETVLKMPSASAATDAKPVEGKSPVTASNATNQVTVLRRRGAASVACRVRRRRALWATAKALRDVPLPQALSTAASRAASSAAEGLAAALIVNDPTIVTVPAVEGCWVGAGDGAYTTEKAAECVKGS
jgi:hypothetical protein